MAEDRLGPILDAALAGSLPANVTLMRLYMEAPAPAVAEALAERDAEGEAAGRLAALRALHDAHPGAADLVSTVLAQARHDAPAGDGSVAHWAAVFDDLARTAPEGGVALYGLGSADLLAAATAEVVALLRRWGLTGPDRRLLDLGCGIGRLSLALAPHMEAVLGLDLSSAMVAEARRRGCDVPNVRFAVSNGRDLSNVTDGDVDLVLAADVFPYLVLAGSDLPGRIVTEAARVLHPGGALVVLNYSYRGNLDLDRVELGAALAAAGLATERDGTRDLALWDAAAWIGRKPG